MREMREVNIFSKKLSTFETSTTRKLLGLLSFGVQWFSTDQTLPRVKY